MKEIDLVTGLYLEEPNGHLAGPVTRFILEEQYYRLKFGDSYFYQFTNGRNPFNISNFDFIFLFGLPYLKIFFYFYL